MKTYTKTQLDVMIKQMFNIASASHMGQFRRDGTTPYIEHVKAVADLVEDRLKPIALGHDLLEDTEITLNDLKNVGFPDYILKAINDLTHRPNEPNLRYWNRILKNPDATIVKIADIKHNLSDSPKQKQIEKYKKALELFSSRGYKVDI
jgi:(p)ppGpp synthase/HD superfamily hydrolase